MTRMCAVMAIGCTLGFASVAAADSPAKRAESRATRAVAPLVVENAICIRQARRGFTCLIRHPDAGGLHCRSTVVVRARRVRVIQSNVCFEIREVTP